MNGKTPRARRKTFNMGDSDDDTITATPAPVVRKRLRGYSLRSNILLRPRRLSIPLPPHHTIVVNSSGGTGGDASKDSSDSEDSDWDAEEDYDSEEWDDGDDTTANTTGMLEVEYRVRPVVQQGDPTETMFWGWVVLASTWVVFVVGMGSVLGVWEWAWGVDTKVRSRIPVPPSPGDAGRADIRGQQNKRWPRSIAGERGFPGEFPIPGYYPAICILTCIMAWVWVVVAWVGMKYFKHAKIQS
jgi:hypothetical protein